MTIIDNIKRKIKENKRPKELLKALEKQNDFEKRFIELNKNSIFAQKIYNSAEKKYGKIFKDSDEFVIYVKKDEELNKKAIKDGFISYLWDTDIMCEKLERHFRETCNPAPDYYSYIKYLAVMPKFVENDQITNIFMRFYQKNEIDYNEKIFDKTIFEASIYLHSAPLMAVLEYYIIKTHDVPFPAYIKALGQCFYGRSANIKDMKPSEDGLSLIPCSHYEFNEIAGNHWDNLTREEQKAEIAKMNEETDRKLREKGLI